MNLNVRQRLSNEYLRLSNRWANRYTPLVVAAIYKQRDAFIEVLKKDGERAARVYLDTALFDTSMTGILDKLFRQFAISYAQTIYKRLIRASKIKKRKKADTGAFGFSEAWNQSITEYLNQFFLVRAVVPVSEGTKKQLLEVLLRGQAEGWGIDRIIQELTNTGQQELTLFRARRIVRTELSISANHADNMVQDSVPFEVDKIWISVHDNRTRDSHEKMDGVTVDGDASFQVPVIKKKVQIGVDLMNGPGDPAGSAQNIINCRCTRAMIPRRDKNGRLIPKQQKIRP